MTEATASTRKQWSRAEIAERLDEFEQGYTSVPSHRQWAEVLGVPCSTLQHWLARKDGFDADPELVVFFESTVGTAFLHRLVLADHLVMALVGPCGIRLACLFLELTGLDYFVVASYGPQQQVSTALEQAVVEFGQTERQRLAAGMPPKEITVGEDETYHPEICLVAIEPVSDFILVEQYVESRNATKWTSTLQHATAGLAVKVIQSTSDEGDGIVKHVQDDLGAHHSPDLFHVRQELTRGPSVALANQRRHMEEAVGKATLARQSWPTRYPSDDLFLRQVPEGLEQQEKENRPIRVTEFTPGTGGQRRITPITGLHRALSTLIGLGQSNQSDGLNIQVFGASRRWNWLQLVLARLEKKGR